MARRAAERSWGGQFDRVILERGRDYAARGLVEDLVDRGDRLEAAVHGSELEPYRVVVELSSGKTRSVRDVRCSCPYDASEWCKHVAAVLVVWTDRPAAARRAPARPTSCSRSSGRERRWGAKGRRGRGGCWGPMSSTASPFGCPRRNASRPPPRAAGWRGAQAKEKVVKSLVYAVVQNVDVVEQLFPVIRAQAGY